MQKKRWAVGVDLGGTKVEVSHVDSTGRVRRRLRLRTGLDQDLAAIRAEIITAVKEVVVSAGSRPAGVGVGVAGQVDPDQGVVRFAPNLPGWQNVPLQEDLKKKLGLPVVVTNDVRAATWGEWLHGAGKGCQDLVCLFVGTGIGGGIVSGGRILSGCSNTAGELGHITVDLNGPFCNCGNRGCLEAHAGGRAIARQAREAISAAPAAGAFLLKRVNGRLENITAKTIAEAAHLHDPLALQLVDRVTEALIAGSASLIHAFNPCRLVLGGGVIRGFPELIARIDRSIRKRTLKAASKPLEVLPARLKNAGVVGAAALAMHLEA